MVTPVLIATHNHEWVVRIFAALFVKYWGDEKVIYFGDTHEGELPENLEFRQVPAYSEGVWPWQHWFGNGLKSICKAMEGQTLALFLADHWLIERVDLEVVARLADYMAHRPGIIRASLDTDWENAEFVEGWQGLDILEVKPWDIHAGFYGGTTFCPSLWNPMLLDKVVEPHWTLWECERLGTEKVKQAYPNIRAIGSKPRALDRVHGLVHTLPKMANLTGFRGEDREIAMRHLPDGWGVC